MTRRKLIRTALLIAATFASIPAITFVRPYVVAKYWGEEANLRGAYLVRAPLGGANLHFADLRGGNLRYSNLRHADIHGALLDGARLEGADLRDTALNLFYVHGLSIRGMTPAQIDVLRPDVNLTGAYYDKHTQWPKGFDPVAAGAVLVE